MKIKKGMYVKALNGLPRGKVGVVVRVVEEGSYDGRDLYQVKFSNWYLGHSCNGLLSGEDIDNGYNLTEDNIEVTNLRE